MTANGPDDRPDLSNLTKPLLDRQESVRFERRMILLAAGMIVLVGIIHLLTTFSTVIQQLLIAVFFVYLLMPPYHWLIRHGFSPLFSGVLMVLTIVLVFTLLGVLIGNSIANLEDKLPRHRDALIRQIDHASAHIPWLGPIAAERLKRLREQGPNGFDQATRLIQMLLHSLSTFLSQTFVVLVYLCFMLAERAGLQERMAKAFDAPRLDEIKTVLHRINASITQYIVIKTAMSLLGGVLTWAVLVSFGIDYAVLWGLMAFLFNYIPYLGSIIATVAPVAVSLVQFENLWLSLSILAVLLIVQNVIGYLIEPRLAGRRLDLSPLVIIIALAFWGSLWGIVGMILAVPLVVVIKAILEEAPATRPLARMLANA